MLELAAIIIGVLIAAVLTIAATRPDTLHVERSTDISAPPETIFALINDFRRWDAWSPYEKKDPGMKRSFSGAASGRGAIYAFDGNGQIGSGRLEITGTSSPWEVLVTLDMLKPMKSSNRIAFTLEPEGPTTFVTWAMDGSSPFIAKLIGLFFNMDKMIGKDFEAGLADLKRLAEAAAASPPRSNDPAETIVVMK